MPSEMSHRERVLAALAGKPVDRPPVSMWRHFFDQESSAEALAGAMLAPQRRYHWDFMKVNPRASYHAEPWGVKVRYTGNRAPETTSTPVRSAGDWAKVSGVRMSHPVFKEQLGAVELISKGLRGQVPFLATVFTPVSIAARLTASDDAFMGHLRDSPRQVGAALEAVTETFVAFSKAALDRGASGLFYATTGFATTDRMSRADYRKLVRPWDLKLLAALPRAEFHLLHVCRDHNMLADVADYPVHAFNWDAHGTGNPSLAEGKALVRSKAVVGGIHRAERLVQASPAQVYGEARGLMTAMGTRGWMIGTGCTYTHDAPEGNVNAVRLAVDAP